ncbi:hypothetical protein [Burkholderia pyrrocinia]|uniref:hypothetical protein n=1 Tax=Burkholderia pyrrocinia TaxID=60550 RepID=UPI0030CD9D4C
MNVAGSEKHSSSEDDDGPNPSYRRDIPSVQRGISAEIADGMTDARAPKAQCEVIAR